MKDNDIDDAWCLMIRINPSMVNNIENYETTYRPARDLPSRNIDSSKDSNPDV